jgi:predicted nuclease of predicted toxin-antitoxin system
MWLLDANMPLQLVALLRDLGIEADSAVARGWNKLSNGLLVEAAVDANFAVLLTRDKMFGRSAGSVLKKYPEFCVVRVMLAQTRAPQFVSAFLAECQREPIRPAPGRTIDWPAGVINI